MKNLILLLILSLPLTSEDLNDTQKLKVENESLKAQIIELQGQLINLENQLLQFKRQLVQDEQKTTRDSICKELKLSEGCIINQGKASDVPKATEQKTTNSK